MKTYFPDIPLNSGFYRAVKVTVPDDTIVSACALAQHTQATALVGMTASGYTAFQLAKSVISCSICRVAMIHLRSDGNSGALTTVCRGVGSSVSVRSNGGAC